MHFKNSVSFLAGSYDKEQFYEMAKGLEEVKEGGERCMKCYEMRLKKTAQKAAEGGFDFFTTTLSISPMKNAQKLNEIGRSVGAEYNYLSTVNAVVKNGKDIIYASTLAIPAACQKAQDTFLRTL